MNPMHLTQRRRDEDWAMEQFEKSEYVYVAMNGNDGVPYNLPLCVVRIEDALYFHTALEGTALELLRKNNRVCVTCTTFTQRDPQHTTLQFRSAMAFGTVTEVSDTEAKGQIMLRFFAKYLPEDVASKFDAYAVRAAARASVWRIAVDEAVGKENTGDN